MQKSLIQRSYFLFDHTCFYLLFFGHTFPGFTTLQMLDTPTDLLVITPYVVCTRFTTMRDCHSYTESWGIHSVFIIVSALHKFLGYTYIFTPGVLSFLLLATTSDVHMTLRSFTFTTYGTFVETLFLLQPSQNSHCVHASILLQVLQIST